MLSPRLKYILPVALGLLLSACGQETEKKSAKALYLDGYKHLSSPTAQYNFNADIKLDSIQLESMLPDVKLTLKGAADIGRKKYELIPEVKAAMFQVTLPLSLDIKQQSLVIDPSDIIGVMQMFQPGAAGVVERYRNKFVRMQTASLKLEGEQKEQLDQAVSAIAELLDVALDITQETSRNLPESSFQLQPLDNANKQDGAVTAINLTLTAEQKEALGREMISLFKQRINEKDNLPDELRSAIMSGIEEAEAAEQIHESTDSIVYLNDKGQIIRINDRYTYNADGKQARADINLVLSNYGKAEFSITPNDDQIIELDEQEIATIQLLMGE